MMRGRALKGVAGQTLAYGPAYRCAGVITTSSSVIEVCTG